MSDAGTNCRSSPRAIRGRLFHIVGFDHQAAARLPIAPAQHRIAAPFVQIATNEAGAETDAFGPGGANGRFGALEHGAGETAACPYRMDVEAVNPVGVIGAKSGERAATVRDIGDQEGFAVMGHGPDVTFRLQATRPAFQLSAAVDARRHAADRFLMDALD